MPAPSDRSPPLSASARGGGAGPEEKAIRVAIACSIFGAFAKLTAGVLSGSMSMISSAVDSMGDLLVSGVNLFVVRYGEQPPDDDHNYGHAKIEGLGAMFEGGFIFAAGLFVVYESIRKALRHDPSHDPTLGLVVMIPVLAVTTGTVLYLRRAAKETGSLVLRSDALHYMTDVWVNVGVLVSLALVKLTGLPIIDTVISLGIALYMLYSSVAVVREGFDVVMDTTLPDDVIARVTAILRGCTTIDSFHDFKTRRGKYPHVDFHVVVRPEMTALEIHELYEELRDGIRGVVGPRTTVLMHTDPLDDSGVGSARLRGGEMERRA